MVVKGCKSDSRRNDAFLAVPGQADVSSFKDDLLKFKIESLSAALDALSTKLAISSCRVNSPKS